jgi:hypothetical protein
MVDASSAISIEENMLQDEKWHLQNHSLQMGLGEALGGTLGQRKAPPVEVVSLVINKSWRYERKDPKPAG